jgi:gamma-glutamyl phosphate reductase
VSTRAAPPRSTAAERQRIIEENRKDAEAAQKIVDDQKGKARLEEENKKLKAQLEKAKNVPDPVPKSPRPKSATKHRVTNSVRRVKAV